MKKHFLSFILLALTLGWSANAWANATLPAGTYVITFANPNTQQIEIFNGIQQETWITFNDNLSCNTGVNKSNLKHYYNNSGMTTLVLSMSTEYSQGGGFLHIRIGDNTWKDWKDYNGTPINVGTNENKVFHIKIDNDGNYTWGNKCDELPTCAGVSCGGGDDPTPTPTIPSVLQLDGNWSGHDWGTCQELTGNENVFTKTISVTSTTQFECCFKNDKCDAAALVKPNTQEVTSYTGTNCTVGTSGDPNNNFTVTPSHTGNISITVTYGNNGAISVNFAQETAPTPTDPCPNCKTITK